MKCVYPCKASLDEMADREAYVVTLPDVYGTTTEGWSWEEAIENAEYALVAALGASFGQQGNIPFPSPVAEGQVPINVPVVPAAKLALNRSMRGQGIMQRALAERLGWTADAKARPCNPDSYSHASTIENALRIAGCGLVVEESEDAPSKHSSKQCSRSREAGTLG